MLFSPVFCPGEYTLRVLWNGELLPKFPLVGILARANSTVSVSAEQQQEQQQAAISRSTMQSSRTTTVQQQQQNQQNQASATISQSNQPIFTNDKVVLTGSGLQLARVNEHAEFMIDGGNAGPGISVVYY